MVHNKPIDPKEILRAARRILLIDWPNTGVPEILVKIGFTVFGYSPGRYTGVEVSNKEKEHLVFLDLDGNPGKVDIVNVYRPEQEHPDIISKHVLPLGAKVLWLHPPVTSEKTRLLAAELGLTFIEGISIADAACK
jgi:predicted CoA-binding protein